MSELQNGPVKVRRELQVRRKKKRVYMDTERAFEMLNKGDSGRKIAKVLGVSPDTVYRWAKKNGYTWGDGKVGKDV